MIQLDASTAGCSVIILMSRRLHSLYHNEIYTVWSKYQILKTFNDLTFVCYIVCDLQMSKP